MQRDHYLPLQVIGEHLDAIDRGLEPPPSLSVGPTVPRGGLAADGLPSPESFAPHGRGCGSRAELLKIAEIDEALLDELEQYGLVAPRPDRPLRRRRLVIARPRASWPASGSSRGTCARSRPPPTARSGWSSRSSPRSSAAATPPPRARRGRHARDRGAVGACCTPRW